MSRCLIENYRNIPGEHCGSTAMRNLLFYYRGVELSEEEVFGLGAGADCVLIESESVVPGVLLFGRGATLERDVAEALGVDYREQVEFDDEKAWRVVRDEVQAGRPTMLSGDVLYLDYRDFKVHFPGHRFVLVGFDDEREVALVADRLDVEIQECSYAALARSRNPKDFISTYNTWGRFGESASHRDLRDAFALALARNAARMLDRDRDSAPGFGALHEAKPASVHTGIEALEALVEVVAGLGDRPNAREIARYAAACIESFGTGGGNFRKLYAGFLCKAREYVPGLVSRQACEQARRSAESWTVLSEHLRAFSKTGVPSTLTEASSTVTRIRDLESDLFDKLASATVHGGVRAN